MNSAKGAGRVIGILLLAQAVVGTVVFFVLLDPAIAGPAGFLTNAAANSSRFSLAALLMIGAGVLSISLSTVAWPVFKKQSERMALAYFGLGVAGLALAAVESATVMSMLTLSQQYSTASPADARLFEVIGGVVRYARYWAHYTQLIVGSVTLFLFYTILFRFAFVPRLLAGAGMIAVLIQFTGLTMPFFGNRINFYLLAPVGVGHLVLGVWLIVKGFADTDRGEYE